MARLIEWPSLLNRVASLAFVWDEIMQNYMLSSFFSTMAVRLFLYNSCIFIRVVLNDTPKRIDFGE